MIMKRCSDIAFLLTKSKGKGRMVCNYFLKRKENRRKKKNRKNIANNAEKKIRAFVKKNLREFT